MLHNPRLRLGINLSRAARLIRTRLDERLGPLGLTQAKWIILMHLSRNDGRMPQKELTETVGVEGPTVVRVLDGLERLGLLERRDQPADRRTKDICLLPAAGPIIEQLTQIIEEFREEMWAGISEEDLAVCDRVMCALLGNLGVTLKS